MDFKGDYQPLQVQEEIKKNSTEASSTQQHRNDRQEGNEKRRYSKDDRSKRLKKTFFSVLELAQAVQLVQTSSVSISVGSEFKTAFKNVPTFRSCISVSLQFYHIVIRKKNVYVKKENMTNDT
uniref:Uncharacterized protein n=1 Tax=Setaria digitata TaxID=48799 RepID=A0A915PLX6_9BILA